MVVQLLPTLKTSDADELATYLAFAQECDRRASTGEYPENWGHPRGILTPSGAGFFWSTLGPATEKATANEY
jgi:hypothetical protein